MAGGEPQSGTFGRASPGNPTGRDDALKQHSVWVRIPPGAPESRLWTVGGIRQIQHVYDDSFRRRALAALATGRPIGEVAREFGVNRATLRSWLQQPVALVVNSCFRCAGASPSDVSAYATLLGFYLGDGCLSVVGTKVTLRVSCDASYPGIIDDVGEVINAMEPRGRVFHVAAPGAVVVQAMWKHWLCLFPQHGPGRKHERLILLEPWQQEIVEALPADFLRGLFHSDGCRAKNWATRMVGGVKKRYDYPRWHFTNSSEDIQELCCASLDLLKIPWRKSYWKTISVSTRAGVARLDELIGLKA